MKMTNFLVLSLAAVLIMANLGSGKKFRADSHVPAFTCGACQAAETVIYPNIIGGEPAIEAEFPYYAKLHISKGGKGFLCGATLISREYVITAAHCVLGASSVRVELGRTTAGSTTVVYENAKKITVHQSYNSKTLVDDIAILKISQVTFNSAISPICLPEDDTQKFESVIAIAIGYGLTSAPGGSTADALQKAALNTATEDTCTPKRICATHESKSICFGDSGGALIYSDSSNSTAAGNETLIGISSYVSSSSCLGGNNGFTRVSAYLGWIADEARKPTC